MKIYIGTDHRGFELKQKLTSWLSKDHDVKDLGAFEYDKDDDYTLYAEKVASVVADQPQSLGILLCGSGVGVNIVANKIDGARASLGKSASQVKKGRKHDDMNILIIASDFTTEKEAKAMIRAFLTTNYDKKSRHQKRLEDIERIEANN